MAKKKESDVKLKPEEKKEPTVFISLMYGIAFDFGDYSDCFSFLEFECEALENGEIECDDCEHYGNDCYENREDYFSSKGMNYVNGANHDYVGLFLQDIEMTLNGYIVKNTSYRRENESLDIFMKRTRKLLNDNSIIKIPEDKFEIIFIEE